MANFENATFYHTCGQCGGFCRIDGKRAVDEDGDIITLTYIGKCPRCGNYADVIELYQLREWNRCKNFEEAQKLYEQAYGVK